MYGRAHTNWMCATRTRGGFAYTESCVLIEARASPSAIAAVVAAAGRRVRRRAASLRATSLHNTRSLKLKADGENVTDADPLAAFQVTSSLSRGNWLFF